MNSKKEVQHVYLVGAKSLGAYGGYETFVYKLTEYHQNKENIKYHVACKANGDGCMDESKFDGVTKINEHEFELHNAHCFKIDVPQIGPAQAIYYDVAALKACCRHIKENHIPHPIVYIMACRIGLFAGHFYKEIHKLGGTVYLNPDGVDWQREKWQSGFGSKFIRQGEKNAVKYADEIIVLSKGVQDYFKETYGRKTHFIPNGVNRPQIREANLITEKFGLKKDSYILFLGRLVPEKGIRYLVEAFKNVKTDKKLVIAGGSSDTDSFMAELKELAKGDDRILFTGFVQGAMLDELYSNAYIYTLPSDLEGMPLSLLEAMSYGNCCLVSDIPECAEVVEDKALIFKKADVQDLQEKLQDACDHPEKVDVHKEQAADFICKKYNWDEVTKETMRLYRRK